MLPDYTPAAVALFETYVLYKVWTSRSEKDLVWYALGAAVGINILLKVGAGYKIWTSQD